MPVSLDHGHSCVVFCCRGVVDRCKRSCRWDTGGDPFTHSCTGAMPGNGLKYGRPVHLHLPWSNILNDRLHHSGLLHHFFGLYNRHWLGLKACYFNFLFNNLLANFFLFDRWGSLSFDELQFIVFLFNDTFVEVQQKTSCTHCEQDMQPQ